MKTTREKNPLALGLFCAALLAGHGAGAQVFPNKPLRIIVPAPPGNTSDAAVRLIGQKMSVPLGQPVVVENRAGASGSIGTNAGLRAAPDGYTLTMISSTSTVAAMHLIKNLPYNPMTEMAPIASFFSVATVIVGAKNLAPNTFKELVDYAKARPGALSYAYSNATGAVIGASVKQVAGIDWVAISYKAGTQAVAELLGGQVPIMINDIALTLPHIRAGSVKPYAVTSARRSNVIPDVPTLSELLPERVEFFGWTGFVAPLGTPQPVVNRLNAVVNEILKTEEMNVFLRNMGAEPVIHTPEQLAAYIKSEEPKWGNALKAAGIQPE